MKVPLPDRMPMSPDHGRARLLAYTDDDGDAAEPGTNTAVTSRRARRSHASSGGRHHRPGGVHAYAAREVNGPDGQGSDEDDLVVHRRAG